MWFTSISLHLATVISMMTVILTSDGYPLGGINGCCMSSCLPNLASCNCPCGLLRTPPQFPFLLPSLPTLSPPSPAPALPQFPTFPYGGAGGIGGGGYATPLRQPITENGYPQQSSSYRTSPNILNQQFQSYQNARPFGQNAKEVEQSIGGATGGYATNPFGIENGNFGDYTPTHNFPHVSQNQNRFDEVEKQIPVSGVEPSMSGPTGHQSQLDIPEDATVGTSGTEYNSSPKTAEYEKKIKSYLKLRKSQLA